MLKGYLKTAALLGAFSVSLGAFAAHGLKEVVTEKALITFETGVRYQFYHVFALFIAAMLYREFPYTAIRWACRLFIIGIVLFSGSLYLLTFLGSEYSFLGAITPFGGLSFIAGWFMLLVAFFKKPALRN